MKMTLCCLTGSICCVLLVLLSVLVQENVANPVTLQPILNHYVGNLNTVDAVYDKSFPVLQEDSEENEANYYAIADDHEITTIANFEPVVCKTGKSSGWLHCHDSTGGTKHDDAEDLCRSSNQKLWLYVPAGSLGSQRRYSYWICSKSKKNKASV